MNNTARNDFVPLDLEVTGRIGSSLRRDQNEWGHSFSHTLDRPDAKRAMLEIKEKIARNAAFDPDIVDIASQSLMHAKRFIDLLPPNWPTPEIGLDPDGEVSFEWYKTPDKLLAISVSREGDLHFAGRFGVVEKDYGTKHLNEAIPLEILAHLRKVVL